MSIGHRRTGKQGGKEMSYSAKGSRHRNTRTATSMVRLALGPLILTGLFLAGSLHASSARAETIDLTSQPGFTVKTVDWLEDGSTLKLKTDFATGRTDQVFIRYWTDGQYHIYVTPTGAKSGIPETNYLVRADEGGDATCALQPRRQGRYGGLCLRARPQGAAHPQYA